MSFDPTSLAHAQYSGTPSFRSIDNAVNPNASWGRRCIPLHFIWLEYWTAYQQANIAVPFVLQGGNNVGGLLDKIRSVKIDNTNSLVPITVFFPDTGDLITCAPDTVSQGPVFTNGASCLVIAQGLNTGNTPQTRVFLYNFDLPPNIDTQVQLTFPQNLGSPVIQRANALTPGFASPALGDQLQQFVHPLSVNGAVANDMLFGGVGTDFIYLTGIEFQIFGSSTPFGTILHADIAGAISGNLFTFGTPTVPMAFGFTNVFTAHRTPGHMNLRLRGDEIWTFTLTCDIGELNSSCILTVIYTRNPI